eukprot:1257732-Pleurochrysis_carterae.AAC.1
MHADLPLASGFNAASSRPSAAMAAVTACVRRAHGAVEATAGRGARALEGELGANGGTGRQAPRLNAGGGVDGVGAEDDGDGDGDDDSDGDDDGNASEWWLTPKKGAVRSAVRADKLERVTGVA